MYMYGVIYCQFNYSTVNILIAHTHQKPTWSLHIA